MADLHEMRLFPLGTVLFPGMVLPLNIFEKSYRIMISECIENNEPFGVVLIDQGFAEGPAKSFQIGTTARITHVQPFDDGRMNIQSVGYQRIRVAEFLEDRPYPAGMVEVMPIATGEPEAIETLMDEIKPRLISYLNRLMELTDTDLELDELPDDGLALALFAAITMPVPMRDKQDILEEPDVVSMLRRERDLLKRELVLLDNMSATQDQSRTGPTFSAN
ncbi:MAG: LON peptidase substrate-binding domain-containing protein [Anaerolineae bacterium]